jgi:hypothetical protein
VGGFPDSEIPLLPTALCLSLHSRSMSLSGAASRLEADGASGRGHAERQSQPGSLAGAVHLLNDNVDVQRGTHRGRKPRVEHKGKSPLDLAFHYEEKR